MPSRIDRQLGLTKKKKKNGIQKVIRHKRMITSQQKKLRACDTQDKRRQMVEQIWSNLNLKDVIYVLWNALSGDGVTEVMETGTWHPATVESKMAPCTLVVRYHEMTNECTERIDLSVSLDNVSLS